MKQESMLRRTYRPRGRRTVAAVGALLWGFFFFGFIDLLAPLLPFDDFVYTQLLEAGWGVLYFVLVTVPLLSLAFVPVLTSPVTQVGLAGCAVGVAAVLTQAWPQLLPAFGLLLTAAVVYLLGGPSTTTRPAAGAHPTGRAAKRDIPSLLLATAAAIPLIWFAVEIGANVRAGLRPNDDITAGLSHWPMQAALSLGLLATAGLVGLRQTGWQVSAWTVTVGAGWMGVLSTAHPHDAGSFGLLGGVAAILWAILFAAATVRSTRRAQPIAHEQDG
jgi:hypothetical protein